MTLEELFNKGLILVTGKGGVGKTTLALSLSLLNGAHGRRAIVAFSDRLRGLKGIAPGKRRAMSKETKLDEGVYGITIYPDKALEEYVRRRFFHVLPFYNPLLKIKAIEYFFEAAPGLKELVTIGKVWHLGNQKLRRGGKGGGKSVSKYDQVIFDAPSSGYAMPLFRVPEKVLKLVKGGPFREHVVWVEEFLNNPEMTVLVTVTTPEEMAIEETREIVEQAEEVGIRHAFSVLNRVYPQRFTVCEGRVIERLLNGSGGAFSALNAARSYLEREELSRKYRRELAEITGGKVVSVRERFKATLGVDDMRDIAREIEEQITD